MRVGSHIICLGLFAAAAQAVLGQAPLPIYTDSLVNGFQNWSWAPNNLTNTSPVHSGSKSISVTANYWDAMSFHQTDFDTTIYTNLTFWIHGGTIGGQVIQVYANYGSSGGPAYTLSALPANTWQQFNIALSDLGIASATNVNSFTFQLTSAGTSGTFFMDDIQLIAKPAPTLVYIGVNANQAIRSADARWFGVNTAIWDSYVDTAITPVLLTTMGCLTLRYPGGSRSDDYHWANNTTVSDNNSTWPTSPSKFAHTATNIGAQVFITVNYGTGTPEEAAAWVRSSNVTNHYGYKYWEIGNECYGTWEEDNNTYAHDPYTYAVRATNYIAQMRAVDPTIKIGVVVVTGEDSFSNGYSGHPAYNSRTGQTHNGWTPVLLSTLKSLGVTPDFLIYHFYPQYTPPVPPNPPPVQNADCDALLLQVASNWSRDAADLRQQINDYFGSGGTNIELICTENNCDAGGFGKQLTSLVNGLYLADSMAQMMKTEFNGLMWWDLRNGSQTTGSFDPSLYGWRTVGDEGMISGTATRYPVYYAASLMQFFVRPGDTVLSASSDHLLLSAYAARKKNGGLTVLVINKDSVTNFNAQITVTNFVPSATARLYSYGIPQDEAVRTNGPFASQQVVTNSATVSENFTNSFPPYSLTLFSFAPAAPRLVLSGATATQFVFQLQGQAGAPYVLQSSTNFTNWISFSTNILTGSALSVTNSTTNAETSFWRALWQP